VVHAFTVDVEEWYHPILPYRQADFGPSRLVEGMAPLLDLLDRHGVKATLFWVGQTARSHARLLRRLADAGHEVGCHGLAHDGMIYDLSPGEFRRQTREAITILEDIAGCGIRGYRAPFFSITPRIPWATEVLAELGLSYDCSIFPVKNWRYGDPSFPLLPTRLAAGLWEYPLPVRRMWRARIPATGGAYFRLYPYRMTASNIRRSERDGLPVVFYVHPWELDPGHPVVRFDWRAWGTHYANLRRTRPRLERLLDDFDFAPIRDVHGGTLDR